MHNNNQQAWLGRLIWLRLALTTASWLWLIPHAVGLAKRLAVTAIFLL
jgi:hypothetical protein